MKTFLLWIYNSIFQALQQIHKYYHRHRWHYNHTNKIALCCIAKMENLYIKEFVEHYRDIGFNKIFIYDNNDYNGEVFDDVIGEYIQSDFCEIINFRGKKKCQIEAYEDCYIKHNKEYDWIAFFDCDEFLTFKDKEKDIHSFLRNSIFNPYQIVAFNWMVFGDNELLTYDKRGVKERFLKPVLPFNFKGAMNFPENDHIKTIIRGNLKDISWKHSITGSHMPYSKYIAICNANANSVPNNAAIFPFNFKNAYLRHYSTKTIEEYILGKKKRGFPDCSTEESMLTLNIDYFFRYNNYSKEKADLIKHLLQKQDVV